MESITKHVSLDNAKGVICVKWNGHSWSFKKPENADYDGCDLNIVNPSQALISKFNQWRKSQEHAFIKQVTYEVLMPEVLSAENLSRFLKDESESIFLKGKTGSFRRRISA
jgi:hypothetical protein